MVKTANNPAPKNHILTLTKEIGNLWIIENVTPFGMKFERFFDEKLGHDIIKLTFIGAANHVLDILAGDAKRMDIELCMASERMNMPGYVEFERVETGHLSSKYHVNNCPGCPQLQAWISSSAKAIFKEYPSFAYIKKKSDK